VKEEVKARVKGVWCDNAEFERYVVELATINVYVRVAKLCKKDGGSNRFKEDEDKKKKKKKKKKNRRRR